MREFVSRRKIKGFDLLVMPEDPSAEGESPEVRELRLSRRKNWMKMANQMEVTYRRRLLGLLTLQLLVLMTAVPSVEAKIRLSGVFSDHMVVQRDKPVSVFGYAEPDGVVGVRIDQSKAVATADKNGYWKVSLPALPAGGPHELVVVDRDEQVVVQDVLVGEVWFCSGQSNMAMSVGEANLAKRLEDLKLDGNIRAHTVPISAPKEPLKASSGGWSVVSAANAQECAAIPLLFASELRAKLGVPVGLVINAVKGSKIQSWLSEEALKDMRDGSGVLSKVDEHHDFLDQWLATKSVDKANLQPPSDEDEKFFSKTSYTTMFPPVSLFNGMYGPILPYSCRGMLWYQGESNIDEFLKYPKFFSALIQDLRGRWSDPELPVLYVQLAPVGRMTEKPVRTSPVVELRKAQMLGRLLPAAYMAVALDSCHEPQAGVRDSDKSLIAHRLAQIALATQYNQPCAYRSPTASRVVRDGHKLKVMFKDTAGGLRADGEVKGFAIAGDDNELVPARAVIEGESVIVWNDSIREPSTIAYAWADYPVCNLYNQANLPAAPFKRKVH